MHFRTAVSRRQRRIYRVSTDRLSGSSVHSAPAMPAEMRRAVVKGEPTTFVRVDPVPDGSMQDGWPHPSARPPRSPAPKPDQPLSTALVTARPPLSRDGRSADLSPMYEVLGVQVHVDW